MSEEYYVPGLLEMYEMAEESRSSRSSYVPEVSMLGEEVDYDLLHRSAASPRVSLMSDLSAESVSAGFIPSVVMCAGCGNLPAEVREMSVFALCEGCCEKIRWRTLVIMSGSSDLPGLPGWSEMSEGDRMTAVWRDMHSKYGYAMMDAELAKMFD